MVFSFLGLPLCMVVIGEERVGLVGHGIDMCQTQAVGHGQCSFVHTLAPYHIHLIVVGASLQCLVKRMEHLNAGCRIIGLSGNHHIAAVGQGALGQRLECLASHYNSMPRGQVLKMFKIGGQVIKQAALVAYGAVCSERTNDG